MNEPTIDGRQAVKLYEIVALVKYAVVVAAVSEADAMQQIQGWEQCWPTSSDLIGVSDVELTDVRDVRASDLEDEAHEVTAAASAVSVANETREGE